jgi:hypothetical protein
MLRPRTVLRFVLYAAISWLGKSYHLSSVENEQLTIRKSLPFYTLVCLAFLDMMMAPNTQPMC